jgi:glucose/arabinose dehydrogenase
MQVPSVLGAALVGAALLPAAAQAQGPPPPTAVTGANVQTVAPAGSVQSPVAFAFGAGKVFVASGGNEQNGSGGGVYVAGAGKATLVPNSPKIVFGLVWHKGTLYVSGDQKLYAYTGWNGTRFAKRTLLFKGPKHFSGFGGLNFHHGRVYAGVAISNFKYDSRKSPQPYAQSVVTLKPDGSDIRVVAHGLREPWQMTFVKGIHDPFVSVLAQDNLKVVPDYIIRAREGQNYGFPKCNWTKPKACKPFATPYLLLEPHASPMGIGSIGKTIYVALFGKQEVDRFKVGGGKPKAFLKGFVAPVTGLGIKNGWVYSGDLTGAIYRVKS